MTMRQSLSIFFALTLWLGLGACSQMGGEGKCVGMGTNADGGCVERGGNAITQTNVCGDDICTADESCSSCATDCGACRLDCGDDQADIDEACDGQDLLGESCQSLGLGSGALACDDDCGGFDTSGCETVSSCEDLAFAKPEDTQAPTTPDELSAEAINCRKVKILWDGAADTGVAGLAGYRVYRNGEVVAETTGSARPFVRERREFTDQGLSASTSYEYAVSALDLAGNESELSDVVTVATGSAQDVLCTDKTPPPVPVNPQAYPVAGRCHGIQFKSYDPVVDTGGSGLKGYRWYLDGEHYADTDYRENWSYVAGSNPGWILPSRKYMAQASAIDHAGNESELSEPVLVNMPDCPEVTHQGEYRVHVVLLNFPDALEQSITEEEITPIMDTASEYFREISYGNFYLSHAVSGWFTMPKPIDDYCEHRKDTGEGAACDTKALEADAKIAAETVYGGENFNKTIFIFNGISHRTFACGIDIPFGVGNFSSSEVAYFVMRKEFYLLGTSRLECGEGNTTGVDITDPWLGCEIKNAHNLLYAEQDPLASWADTTMHHISAFRKQNAGFLGPDQVRAVRTSRVLLLDQLEYASEGIKELRIPMGYKYFYTLEYRRPVGLDAPHVEEGEEAIEGIPIRLKMGKPHWYKRVNTALISDRVVTPGEDFLDPHRKIRVRMLDKNEDRAVVEVCR